MDNPGKRADAHMSHFAEDLNRKLGRREALGRMIRGAATIAAAISIGDLGVARGAFASTSAVTCGCAYPGCGHCTTCEGKQCPDKGCPTGCTKCLFSDSCGGCIYGDGSWNCCTNCCGATGTGYSLCYDCKCPGCGHTCGCRSKCL